MHIVYDEQGNLVAHGGHEHMENSDDRENLALLTYMLDHNRHHSEELEELAARWEAAGHVEEAIEIRKGVEKYQEGNQYISNALAMVQKEEA